MIRQARFDDIDSILMVVLDAKELFLNQGSSQWQSANGYPNRDTFLTDLEHNTILVVEEERCICAVAVVTRGIDPSYNTIYQGAWISNLPYIAVHRIAVKKEYYRQGLAKKLLLHAEEIARKEGYSSIKIDTHEKNIPMQGLMKQLGYTYCGIIYLVNAEEHDKKRLAYEKKINAETLK